MNAIPAFDVLGLPAPLWLLWGLKVFGFWVHLFFMNLWFAGFGVGLLLAGRSGPLGTSGRRLVGAMPVLIAFGVNAGIVPLLFLQVVFPQLFYTTTILQAWAWFAILPLLLVAYYGTYVYVLGRKAGRSSGWVTAAGWGSALVFLAIGVVLSTEMQLLTRPEAWMEVAGATTGGAVAGTGLAVGSGALLRYVMMFGLALATTGAWLAFDRDVLRRHSTEDGGARGALPRVVVGLTAGGVVVFGAAALPYLGTAGPWLVGWPWLRVLAGAGPFLALAGAILYLVRPGRATALALLGLQLASLLFNAMARQVVQIGEIGRVFDPASAPVHLQLSPIVLFLVTLGLGLAVVTWLLVTFARAAVRPEAA